MIIKLMGKYCYHIGLLYIIIQVYTRRGKYQHAIYEERKWYIIYKMNGIKACKSPRFHHDIGV